jgi:chitodextrinase
MRSLASTPGPRRSAIVAAACCAVFLCIAEGAGATGRNDAGHLPPQLWALALDRPPPASMLTQARASGVDGLLLDRSRVRGNALAALRHAAAGAQLPVYEIVHVGSARTAVSRASATAACAAARKRNIPCLLFTRDASALAALDRIRGLAAVVLSVGSPVALGSLSIPHGARVIVLAPIRVGQDAGMWSAAVRAAAANPRIDLAVEPPSRSQMPSVAAYFDLLAARSDRSAGETAPTAPQPQAPGAPTGVSATVGSTRVSLSWVGSADAAGYDISGEGFATQHVTGTNATIENLVCGASYRFDVRAVSVAGLASPAASVTASPAPCGGGGGGASPPAVPLPPTVVIATHPVARTRATNATIGFASPDGGLSFECALDTGAFNPCVSPLTLSGLGDGVHTVGIRASAGGLVGAATTYSWSVDATPPSVPGGLVASAVATGSFVLGWTASSDNDAVTGYRVTVDGGAPSLALGTSSLLTGFSCDTSHAVGVAAVDAAGNISGPATLSVSTAACPDTVPPSAPGDLAWAVISSDSVTLTWTASADNVGVTGYRISLDGLAPATSSTEGYVVHGLSCETQYDVRVAALDAAGNVSEAATLSVTTSGCPDTSPPSVPADLSASAVSTDAITLTWTASTDDMFVSDYEVFVNDARVGTSTDTSYPFAGLVCGTSYTLGVAARDAAGNESTRSSLAVATSPCLDTTPPSAPSGLVGSNVGSTSVTLAWTASVDDQGVTGYQALVDGVQVGAPTGTTYDFTGLACGTSYTLGVDAVDAAGNPSGAATLVISTSVCPDTSPPSIPSGLSASEVSASSIALSWAASTDDTAVAGYAVLRGGASPVSTTAAHLGVTGLAACTSYTFSVTARDDVGNESSASAALIVTTTGCAATADFFVASDGSDDAANSCSAAASPCETFQAAFDRAGSGDVVQVAGGSYPSQTITGDRGGVVTFRPAAGATLTMSGTLFIERAKHVKLVDFNFPRSDPTWELAIETCNDDVTLQNSTGRRFFILEGNSNITFHGGSWGGYATPDDADSGIGTSNGVGLADPAGLARCGEEIAPPAHNVLFDGVTFHDVFWNAGCTSAGTICGLPFGVGCTTEIGTCTDGWGFSHPDCLEINGYVDGVTIENSTFVHCGNTMLSLFTDQGNVDNVVVRNNTFRDMAPTTYYGMQWTDTTEGYTCSGDKFLNNTYTPNTPDAWQAGAPPRFECNLAPGGVPTEVAGNRFQVAPNSIDCQISLTENSAEYTPAHEYRTAWHDNLFEETSADYPPCQSP